MNTNTKKHLISALNTFIPAFFLAIFSMPINVENLDKATITANTPAATFNPTSITISSNKVLVFRLDN